MFVLMSIHHPRPEHEAALIDSMHRYGGAISGMAGLRSIHTLQDERSNRLVGLAIFESRADFERLAPIAREAVKDDPFDVWEEVEIDGLALGEV
jgi:heme-degrading monooxygenase HmoA